ncbi:MAG: response regulator transcription factor [Actinomycetota bacterium]
MTVRVAVVDDTEHVRGMLVSMLSLDGFEVVGEGSRGEDALDLARDLSPDVLVIDYSMPDMDGLTAARMVKESVPKQGIILYTAYLDDALRDQAREAGVAICVGKVEGLETLERSISELCLQLGSK